HRERDRPGAPEHGLTGAARHGRTLPAERRRGAMPESPQAAPRAPAVTSRFTATYSRSPVRRVNALSTWNGTNKRANGAGSNGGHAGSSGPTASSATWSMATRVDRTARTIERPAVSTDA